MDETLNDERWIPVVGFEGIYEVSSLGRVQSLDRIVLGKRTRFFKGQELKQRLARGGYPTVQLRNANAGRIFPAIAVHRLMALAFLGPPPDGCDRVCHINDDKTDNRVENLMWGNASINGHHAVVNGKHYEAAKTQCMHGHKYVHGSYSIRTTTTGKSFRVCLVCKRIDTNRRRAIARHAHATVQRVTRR